MALGEKIWFGGRREHDPDVGGDRGHQHQARGGVHRHGHAASRWAHTLPSGVLHY